MKNIITIKKKKWTWGHEPPPGFVPGYFLLPQEEEESDIMSLKPVSCEYELVN